MVQIINFLNWVVEHAKRSFIRPACTNGLALVITQAVHCVEISFEWIHLKEALNNNLSESILELAMQIRNHR